VTIGVATRYIIYDIYDIFASLNKIGIDVILEWIPSHVGILGNELADKEAKHSLSLKIYMYVILYSNKTPLMTNHAVGVHV
jgi:ribonuclease HI